MSLDYCLLLEGVSAQACRQQLRRTAELRQVEGPSTAPGVIVLVAPALVVRLWNVQDSDDDLAIATRHGVRPGVTAWLTQDKAAPWEQAQVSIARVVGRLVDLTRGAALFYNTQGSRLELLKTAGVVRVRRDPDRVWTPVMLRELSLPYVEEELPLL